jgi:hypothetical protein
LTRTWASAKTSSFPVVQAHGIRNIHIYENDDWINIKEAGDLTRSFSA